MIVLLNVHFSRAGDLERPDRVGTSPATPVDGYRDGFGNWVVRLVAPPGRFTLRTDAVVNDDRVPESIDLDALQHQVQDLPSDTLVYLLGSRYCETDILSEEAWRRFGETPLGWPRVQAICDFVHDHIAFGYEHSRPTRTASESFVEQRGVCRDYAHLAITFCRCLNISARYCAGYLSDIDVPLPHGVPDFAAWMEVYLGGRWWTFDPRNNALRLGRILVAQGRDAADVPLTQIFGPGTLCDFSVWTAETKANPVEAVKLHEERDT
jgi:transglutaminase-like putative cysteine protease